MKRYLRKNDKLSCSQTRNNNERNASNTDYENNIEQLDSISDASSVVRYTGDGSQDISVESPLPCRSGASSTDGVFFSSSSGRNKAMDNRRLISKSQMKGGFLTSILRATLSAKWCQWASHKPTYIEFIDFSEWRYLTFTRTRWKSTQLSALKAEKNPRKLILLRPFTERRPWMTSSAKKSVRIYFFLDFSWPWMRILINFHRIHVNLECKFEKLMDLPIFSRLVWLVRRHSLFQIDWNTLQNCHFDRIFNFSSVLAHINLWYLPLTSNLSLLNVEHLLIFQNFARLSDYSIKMAMDL